MVFETLDLVPKIVLILQSVLVGLLVLVSYYAISLFLYMRKNHALLAGVKGPEKYHWLFGSFRYFPMDPHERVMYFVDMCNKYGKDQGYILLWGFLGRPVIVTCSPRIMGNICKSNEPKARGLMGVYRFMLPWLGEGLLVAGGSKWARNRRLLTPAFHFEILKPYTNVFNRSTDMLLKKIEKKAESGEKFEVFQNICLCTLEIILKCAFSYNKDVQNMGSSHPNIKAVNRLTDTLQYRFHDTNPYVKAVNRITDSLTARFLNPLLHFDFMWHISARGREFKRDCEYVHSVAEEIIDKRRETLSKQESPSEKRYIDFLDILLTAQDEEGKGLSRLEIRNEVDTFLFEGHDTTASAIAWILYSLAENPQHQKKCQAEIDELLEDRDSDDLEWSDLSQLEYLTMCIKEGMRLHSPVPIVNRQITKDFDLGGRSAPAGSIVQLNIWAVNHMENIWGADHMEFKPERFSKDKVAEMEPFQYVPFSAGPRNCIGQNFAMNEEKVVLSKLLRNFTFRLDPDHKVRKNMSAVMRTQNGMYMFAEKRNH